MTENQEFTIEHHKTHVFKHFPEQYAEAEELAKTEGTRDFQLRNEIFSLVREELTDGEFSDIRLRVDIDQFRNLLRLLSDHSTLTEANFQVLQAYLQEINTLTTELRSMLTIFTGGQNTFEKMVDKPQVFKRTVDRLLGAYQALVPIFQTMKEVQPQLTALLRQLPLSRGIEAANSQVFNELQKKLEPDPKERIKLPALPAEKTYGALEYFFGDQTMDTLQNLIDFVKRWSATLKSDYTDVAQKIDEMRADFKVNVTANDVHMANQSMNMPHLRSRQKND